MGPEAYDPSCQWKAEKVPELGQKFPEQVLEKSVIGLDINIHARRTETMVVSFTNPHLFRRAIIRVSEVLILALLDDVAGLLSNILGFAPQ